MEFWYTEEFWRTVGIIFAAVGQTMFALLYATFPWWRNFVGRALFIKAISFAVLLDVAVFGRLYDWPQEETLFITLYWLVAFGIWWQFIAFLRVRLGSKAKQKTGVGA